MGVTGLWQILHPCARPIKLETLNRKRLAVDASIWIYQFLKAVRDKEGHALRNSHVVGFFRRICKLLFFGIKPVFVFDGGAPALKRQTVSERKKRREGRREDAVRTAGKLLAVQMQRRAEEEEGRRKDEERDRADGWEGEEEPVPCADELVYAEETQMGQEERLQSRRFRKKDPYHLPPQEGGMHARGPGDDPRVMSLEELQAYARQFETGEDINVYDFSKIDYDSPFFQSLPATDRYNILNAARLRSRLRTGMSKEQMAVMFPDPADFTKFQIERTIERNNLTQRLMHVNEGGDALYNGGRVAGERGREYVLVKNDGVEGGWALGVINEEGTKQETAIDVDEPVFAAKSEEESSEDEGFEDVPVEGLNRLPKRPNIGSGVGDAGARQRKTGHQPRRPGGKRRSKPKQDPNSLFVAPEETEEQDGQDWEAVDGHEELFGETEDSAAGDDEELRQAIALSLEQADNVADEDQPQNVSDPSDDDTREVFQQRAVPAAQPVPKASGRAIANLMNKRAAAASGPSTETTSFGVPVPNAEASSDSDDAMDFQAALAESRKTKRKPSPPLRRRPSSTNKSTNPAQDVARKAGFTGPLPFEKLDLGTSLLGKKKHEERQQAAAGGFENPDMAATAERGEKIPARPLPPWFSGDVAEGIRMQEALESEDREKAREFNRRFRFQRRDEGVLRREQTGEVIDLEAEEDGEASGGKREGEVIDLDDDDEEHNVRGGIDLAADEEERGNLDPDTGDTMVLDETARFGDTAEKVRVEPPEGEGGNFRSVAASTEQRDPEREGRARISGPSDSPLKDRERLDLADGVSTKDASSEGEAAKSPRQEHGIEEEMPGADEQDERIEWSDSDSGAKPAKSINVTRRESANVEEASREPMPRGPLSRSPSPEFEDVYMADADRNQKPDTAASLTLDAEDDGERDKEHLPPGMPDTAGSKIGEEGGPAATMDMEQGDQAEFDEFSDPEEEDLLRQLTMEAEEHARFASTLNNKTQAQNIAEYETELKQLRTQQKKDRRDADEVTQIMITECQHLLRLFGLPYVTAPMEAEAQCAELVALNLVDGIVTDDSDCFLFGGTRIYKNMFNQAKFVECYLSSDLEKEFALTRAKLIDIAQLLGSDYTAGLPGIGPVTALELLSEFPSLPAFTTWWTGVQTGSVPKSADTANPFRKKFRRNATKLFLPPSFPDPRVAAAYEHPEVDPDPQPFQWGVPDLGALRGFLMATIGWSQERTDEVLVPVIRDMNRRADEGTQSNLTAFFDGTVGVGGVARGEGFAPRKRAGEGSRRMGSALGRLAEKAKGGGGAESGAVDGASGGVARTSESGTGGRGKARKSRKSNGSRQKDDDVGDDAMADDDASAYEETRSNKRKRGGSKAGRGSGRKKARVNEA